MPISLRVGITAERKQRSVLRLPTKPPDPPFTRPHVDDKSRAAADAVAISIVRIFERDQRVVEDRLDEPCAEKGNGHAAGDDVGVGRHDGLARMRRQRKEMKERFARCVERLEFTSRVAAPRSHLGDRAGPADRRDAVAARAARAVERRSQPFLGLLHLQKVLESNPEFFELDGRDSRERAAGRSRTLRGHDCAGRSERDEGERECRSRTHCTMIVPRMNA